MFNQILVPGPNLWITVLLALVPLIVLLCLLAVFRMTAWLATLIASIVTIPVAILVWHAPASAAIKAYFYRGRRGGEADCSANRQRWRFHQQIGSQ